MGDYGLLLSTTYWSIALAINIVAKCLESTFQITPDSPSTTVSLLVKVFTFYSPDVDLIMEERWQVTYDRDSDDKNIYHGQKKQKCSEA